MTAKEQCKCCVHCSDGEEGQHQCSSPLKKINKLKLDMSLAQSIKVVPVRSSSIFSHLSSPSGSPDSTRSLCSPKRLQKEQFSLEELLSSSSPTQKARVLRRPYSIPRDSTQPIRGCFSNSESTEHVDDEEKDEFPKLYSPRPRSSTCPESRAWKRRLKARTERRPASPPACGVEMSLLSQQLSSMAIKEELHIPHRDLPLLLETDKVGD